MSNRSLLNSLSIAAPLAAAALFVSGNASATRLEALAASHASTVADAACVGNYWTGVSNICSHTIDVQAAATITTAGTYSTNANVYGNASTYFQSWGINSTFDTTWTSGQGHHTTDYYGNSTWAYYIGMPYSTYVPAYGSLLFQVTLPPGQIIAYYNY
jgi:hypothetical protein